MDDVTNAFSLSMTPEQKLDALRKVGRRIATLRAEEYEARQLAETTLRQMAAQGERPPATQAKAHERWPLRRRELVEQWCAALAAQKAADELARQLSDQVANTLVTL